MSYSKISLATFGAGCFWGVQHAFDQVPGIIETKAGYMGGNTRNPTYKQVCDGGTGHIESVQIKYDSKLISYEALLEIFWQQVPKIPLRVLEYHTKQGIPIIFCHNYKQRNLANQSRQNLIDSTKSLGAQITTIAKASEFWPELDEYHQHYCTKNGECR